MYCDSSQLLRGIQAPQRLNFLLLTLFAAAAVTLSPLQLLSGFEGLEVRQDAGGGRGKGLFATQAFKKDDVIFQERPLVSSLPLTAPSSLAHFACPQPGCNSQQSHRSD